VVRIGTGFEHEVTVFDVVSCKAGVSGHGRVQLIPAAAAKVVADLGTLFTDSREGLGMGVDKRFRPRSKEPTLWA
jgi:hypothetical protein